MGHLGTTASGWLLDSCDTLLVVGSNDPWTEFYPAPGQARAVQVDIDGRHLGNRYPVEVGLVGDAAESLAALLPLLEQRDGGGRRWPSGCARGAARAGARRDAGAPAQPRAGRAGPHPAAAGDAQVSVDVGSITYWYARHLTLPPGVPAHLSSTLASMGSGIPYGLAAKLHAPDRPVVALVGDGAMQMNGISELITVAHRWRDWTDPRFVVLVLHNQDLAEVTWEQRETEGDPRFDASQALPTFPYAAYADLLGLTGIRDRPSRGRRRRVGPGPRGRPARPHRGGRRPRRAAPSPVPGRRGTARQLPPGARPGGRERARPRVARRAGAAGGRVSGV